MIIYIITIKKGKLKREGLKFYYFKPFLFFEMSLKFFAHFNSCYDFELSPITLLFAFLFGLDNAFYRFNAVNGTHKRMIKHDSRPGIAHNLFYF